jgi:hypothetical protein
MRFDFIYYIVVQAGEDFDDAYYWDFKELIGSNFWGQV